MLTCLYLSKNNNNCASKGQNTANIGPTDAVIGYLVSKLDYRKISCLKTALLYKMSCLTTGLL